MAEGCAPDRADRQRLARGLEALGLSAGSGGIDRLLGHAALVRHWNARYNLVSRRDADCLLERHVLDSLSIHEHVGPGSLLDVGSGAGFPGIPLAIAVPMIEVTLLDSAGKKTRFMRHVKRTLGLRNVRIAEGRLEAHVPPAPYRYVVSRAFASLADYAAGVRPLAGTETRILAMKGRRPDAELADLPGWVSVERVVPLAVPDLHAERHLVIMCVSPDTRLDKDT